MIDINDMDRIEKKLTNLRMSIKIPRGRANRIVQDVTKDRIVKVTNKHDADEESWSEGGNQPGKAI